MTFTKPSRSDVHIDQVLTSISIATIQEAGAFISFRACPQVSVDKATDLYRVYPKGSFLRSEAKKIRPNTPAPHKNYELSTDTYNCEVRKIAHPVNDQIRANADSDINLDRDATLLVTRDLMIERETDWMQKFFTSGVPGSTWTFHVEGNATATAPGTFDPTDVTNTNNKKLFWNDAASTPIEDIRQGRLNVMLRTGFKPNKMVVSAEVFNVLIDHPDIVGRLDRGQTPVGPAMASREALAALFELDEVLVTEGISNSAAEGLPDNIGFIAGKNALLYYTPNTASQLLPSAMYGFLWSGLFMSDGMGVNIKNFREEGIESDIIEGRSAYDQKVISEDLGYMFNDIIE